MEFTEISSDGRKEITFREIIMNKIRDNVKITPEERIWLTTHSFYNQQCDFEAYNIVVEKIEPNERYSLEIQIESVDYDKRIIPVISVPSAKGSITTKVAIKDVGVRTASNQSVKVLGIEFEPNSVPIKAELQYLSDLGFFAVSYECDYYDEKQNLNMRQGSSTGHPDFAVVREVLDEHTVRYYCKNPINSNNFDALVFSIRKTKIT